LPPVLRTVNRYASQHSGLLMEAISGYACFAGADKALSHPLI
jgi:hypothetical protein